MSSDLSVRHPMSLRKQMHAILMPRPLCSTRIKLLLMSLFLAGQAAPVKCATSLRFEPAGIEGLTLVESATEVLQRTLRLANQGNNSVALRLQAQCDASLSPHQPTWMTTDQQNITLSPGESHQVQVNFTAAALLQGTYQSQICVFNQSSYASSTGQTASTLAQLPVQITVLCARFARAGANASGCSINITQVSLLRGSGQTPELVFEADVVFGRFPWPELSPSAAKTSVTVNGGNGSVYNATLSPPNNQCGISILRGTAALTSADASSASLNVTMAAAANATAVGTATSQLCTVQRQYDTSKLPTIVTLPQEATAPSSSWSPTVRPFTLLPVYIVQGSDNSSAQAKLTLSNAQAGEHSVQVVTDCYNSSSAGDAIPWLSLSRKDVALPANASQDIVLTYNATGVAAGTYRAQLCLFADYSYSDVATVVQVQLIVLCPRFNGYAAAQPGCSITFTNFSSTAVAATPVNYDGPASVQLTPPAAAAPSSSGLPSAEVELRFTAVVAFNRPVVGSQALQSLAGMLRSSGLTAGGITGVSEDLSGGANCGMYTVSGVVPLPANESTNITLAVGRLYDVTNTGNSCTGELDLE